MNNVESAFDFASLFILLLVIGFVVVLTICYRKVKRSRKPPILSSCQPGQDNGDYASHGSFNRQDKPCSGPDYAANIPGFHLESTAPDGVNSCMLCRYESDTDYIPTESMERLFAGLPQDCELTFFAEYSSGGTNYYWMVQRKGCGFVIGKYLGDSSFIAQKKKAVTIAELCSLFQVDPRFTGRWFVVRNRLVHDD